MDLKINQKAFIHTDSFAGRFAFPVKILSIGPKFAAVYLLADFKVNNRIYPKHSIKNSIPISCLNKIINNAVEIKE